MVLLISQVWDNGPWVLKNTRVTHSSNYYSIVSLKEFHIANRN